MIDFTPLVEAIIMLAVSAITVFLIPWMRERYGVDALEKARGWVQVAVLAAEKLYGAGNGDKKLAYAEQVLAQHKIKLDMDTLTALVNAEIKKLERVEIEVGSGELLEYVPPDAGESAAGGGLNE